MQARRRNIQIEKPLRIKERSQLINELILLKNDNRWKIGNKEANIFLINLQKQVTVTNTKAIIEKF